VIGAHGYPLLDIAPTADDMIPVILQERRTQIGDWPRPTGEATYAAGARRKSRPWNAGGISKPEDEELRAAYGIRRMVGSPPTGHAGVEVVPASTNDARYAIVMQRPVTDLPIDNGQASPGWQPSGRVTRTPAAGWLAGGAYFCQIAGAL
jgi:alpha-L-fucosidase